MTEESARQANQPAVAASFYFAYDVASFGRWPLWSLALAAGAAWELVLVRRSTASIF